MNEDWMGLVRNYHPTGSRYICSPPVMNTDEDWVCLPKEFKPVLYQPLKFISLANTQKGFPSFNLTKQVYELEKIGFIVGGSYNPSSPFISLKRDITNLILVNSEEEYNKWVMASRLAKRLNLLNKEDRIALFEAVVRQNFNYEYYIKKPEDWL